MKMQLAHIHIQSQNAEVGLSQTRPNMNIRQHPAVMQIDQELAGTLSISKTASKLYIDQTEAFADANLKSPLRMSSEWSGKGEQAVMNYITKTARDGEQLKKIETGAKVLPQLAKQNGERQPKEVNVGFVPENAFKVTFDFEPLQITVESEWPDPNIEFHVKPPDIQIPKWETDVYLQQKEAISFQATNVDKRL